MSSGVITSAVVTTLGAVFVSAAGGFNLVSPTVLLWMIIVGSFVALPFELLNGIINLMQLTLITQAGTTAMAIALLVGGVASSPSITMVTLGLVGQLFFIVILDRTLVPGVIVDGLYAISAQYAMWAVLFSTIFTVEEAVAILTVLNINVVVLFWAGAYAEFILANPKVSFVSIPGWVNAYSAAVGLITHAGLAIMFLSYRLLTRDVGRDFTQREVIATNAIVAVYLSITFGWFFVDRANKIVLVGDLQVALDRDDAGLEPELCPDHVLRGPLWNVRCFFAAANAPQIVEDARIGANGIYVPPFDSEPDTARILRFITTMEPGHPEHDCAEAYIDLMNPQMNSDLQLFTKLRDAAHRPFELGSDGPAPTTEAELFLDHDLYLFRIFLIFFDRQVGFVPYAFMRPMAITDGTFLEKWQIPLMAVAAVMIFTNVVIGLIF